MLKRLSIGTLTILILSFIITNVPSNTYSLEEKSLYKDRLRIYNYMSSLTNIPWEYVAAFDQYERNTSKGRDKKEELVSINVSPRLWCGTENPNLKDTNTNSIKFFHGIGMDGNGDKKADPNNPYDALYSYMSYLSQKGSSEDSVKEMIWEYYKNPEAVKIISHIAKIYKKFNSIELNGNYFPVSTRYNYTYRGTWGAGRGWGGARRHEGTDIFADYGTPVLSTCYGYVELKGWNKFGGWRIGIRDANNRYHYFAHLSRYKKGLKPKDVVKPGEIIGFVGSTGYGPPGTAGKFPPHLHYGIYKYNGQKTYSFDPYPSLRRWERQTKEN